MGYLTKEAILNADDRKIEELEVPEWGGTIRIREMSGEARELFADSLKDETDDMDKNSTERMVAAMAIDEQGELLFTADDIAALRTKSAVVLTRVAKACIKLSGLEADSVEEETKN